MSVQGAVPVRVDLPHEVHTLANGLRLIVHEDPSVPLVAVNLWYHVGSKDERPGRTGFAHLFEHLMFEGSAHAPEGTFDTLLESVGGVNNGSTSSDRTNYYEMLPASALEVALWLEADRMGWLLPAMTQDKLDGQRDVVKNERRQSYENRPYGLAFETILAALYPPEHPYHWPVIGSMADLDAATLEDVHDFFRTYYAPNNAVLTLCGDFEADQARELVERYFGEIPEGPPVPPIPGRTELPPTLGGAVREVVEQDISLPRIYQAFRTPAYGTDGYYPAAVTANILAWGKASRLYRGLVRERRLAQDVVAFAFPIVVGASMLVLWATARPGVEPETLESALAEELDALRDVSDEEVERAASLLEARRLIDLQRVGERADLLSMYTMLFDDPDLINTEHERLRAVSPAEVRDFVERYLAEENRGTLVYVPKRKEGDDA